MNAFRTIKEVTPDEWREGLGLASDETPDCVILEGSWWRKERQALRLGYLEDVRELGYPDIFFGRWQGKNIMFCMAYGAARAGEVSHIGAAMGAKLVIQIGTCGGLQTSLTTGDIIVPTDVFCQDGVAAHISGSKQVTAAPNWTRRAAAALAARGQTAKLGPHVTFSSLFAETTEMYEAWQAAGLLSVEMEAATTIAAAQAFDVPGLALVAVWDDLSRGRRFSDPLEPDALAALDQSNIDVYEVALEMAQAI